MFLSWCFKGLYDVIICDVLTMLDDVLATKNGIGLFFVNKRRD